MKNSNRFLWLLSFSLFWTAGQSFAGEELSQLFLAKVKDKVEIVRGDKKHKGAPPENLFESDRIVTGPSGQAYLEFQNGGVVEVGPKSDVKVRQLQVTSKDFKAKFLLAFGKFKAKVNKLKSSSSVFEVEAGGVVAGVRGTVFGVDYDKAKNVVSAKTFEGSIFTLVGGKEQVVEKGFSMLMDKTGSPLKSVLSAKDVSDFTDFDNVSGLLEKKKQEMIEKMKGKAEDKLKEKVGEKGEDALKKVIDPGKLF